MYQELLIFSGNAHRELAHSICGYLETPLGECEVFEFSNENVFVRVQENVRERDVFIIQPWVTPVNTNIMELLIMIDAMKRASAGRVTAVVPYYAYGRSDKKDQPRVPITARLLANLIETAGADRLLTMDLHAGQIQGFFNIPVDELTALYTISRYFQEKQLDNLVESSRMFLVGHVRFLSFCVERKRKGNRVWPTSSRSIAWPVPAVRIGSR